MVTQTGVGNAEGPGGGIVDASFVPAPQHRPNAILHLPKWSREEISRHRSSDSLWVSMDGVVYDVAYFLRDHPGGAELLLRYAGRDLSLLLRTTAHGHYHSDVALRLLDDFVIGVVNDYEGIPRLGSGALLIELEGEEEPDQAKAAGTACLYPFRRRAPKLVEGESDLLPVASSSSSGQLFLNAEDDSRLADQLYVDLTRPIVQQVWEKSLSREAYLRFVHTPRFTPQGRTTTFFANPILERLSRNEWWIVLVWVPVALAFYLPSSKSFTHAQCATIFVFGMFMWTLIEYCLHRFVFHLDAHLPDRPIFLLLHFLTHGVHHFLPLDRHRLVMPPALASVFIVPLYLSFALFFPRDFLNVAFAGGLIGFMLYDMTHYYVHHGTVLNSYLAQMKSHHLDHHYKDYTAGFGVTSVLWDTIFHTGFKAARINRPPGSPRRKKAH